MPKQGEDNSRSMRPHSRGTGLGASAHGEMAELDCKVGVVNPRR